MATVHHQHVPSHLPPPLPPSVAQRPSAKASTPNTQPAEKICNFCRKAIDMDATKCPFCQEWQEDIKKARTGIILLGVLTFFCFVASMYVIRNNQHNWYTTANMTGYNPAMPVGMQLNNISISKPQFSTEKFLNSESGKLLIILLVGEIVLLIFSLPLRHYLKERM